MRKLRRVCLVSLLMVCAAGITLAACAFYYVFTPAREEGADTVFLVRSGTTLRDVTRDLERQGLIRKAFPVRVWAELKGYGTRIKAGEYLLSPSLEPRRMFERFVKGAVIPHSVTIPEGLTLEEIADLLGESGLVRKEDFLALAADPAVAREYGLEGETLEGYLFPDTYLFSRGVPARVVVDTMIRRFREVVEPLETAIEASGMSLHEVITLASIVEKETAEPEERPLIAGVFLNRLKRRMRLESDPTVIYAIEDFDGNLTRADLSRRNAYNTYVIPGLPPGPIANPGEEAIRAVLFPAETKFLYFVSRNDGTHHFSKTFSEHRRAVEQYQKKPRRSGGKMS